MKKLFTAKNIKNIVLALVLIAFIIFCAVNRDKITLDAVLDYTPSQPFLAALVIIFFFFIKSLSVVLYSGILFAATGVLFPLPIAMLVNAIGTAVMFTAPFFIGRSGGSDYVQQLKEKYPKLRTAEKLHSNNNFLYVLLLRGINIIPSDILSGYFGAIGISYPTQVVASVLGTLPSIILYPVIGLGISRRGSKEFYIGVIVEGILMLTSIIVFTVYAKRSTMKAEASEIVEAKDET